MAFGKSISLADTTHLRELFLELSTDAAVAAAIRFDGTPVAPLLLRAVGCSGIVTRLGVGNYRITFLSDIVGQNYGAHVSASAAAILLGQSYNKTTKTVDIRIFTPAGVLTDCADVFVTIVQIPS